MKIARDVIRQFVADYERRGVDMRRPMQWGFFFKHDGAAKLVALRPTLEGAGYRYVDVVASDDSMWWLEVSLGEMLTADALFDRCAALHELGCSHGVELDGFDVGNIDGSILY